MLKLILFDANAPGQHETFRVDDDEVQVIGRKAPRLLIPDTRVSRAHAEVRAENGVWVIRDLGSANGTLVNNKLIEGLCELEEDDVIQVGRVTLLVAVAQVASQVRPEHPPAALPPPPRPESPDDTAGPGDPLHDTASHVLTDADESHHNQAQDPEQDPEQAADQDQADGDPTSTNDAAVSPQAPVDAAPPAAPAAPPTPAPQHGNPHDDSLALDTDAPQLPEILDTDDGNDEADQNEASTDDVGHVVLDQDDAQHDDPIDDLLDDEALHQEPSDGDASHDAPGDDLGDDLGDLDDASPPMGHDTPQPPEQPTGLRLANYDVLADDELAEALAADASPPLTADDTPVSMDVLDLDNGLLSGDDDDDDDDDDALLMDLGSGLPADLEADLGPDIDADLDENQTADHTQDHTAHDDAAHTAPPTADADEPAAPPAAVTRPYDDAELYEPEPRHGLASSDSRLVTPAPESALDASRTAHGFPWRSTAAAVITLAAVGAGVFITSRSPKTAPLAPVTAAPPQPQQDPTPTDIEIDTGSALTPSQAPPARRGQPSPFDAGPVLSTRTATPLAPAPSTPPPAPTPSTPPPEPTTTPDPTPLPELTRAAPAPPAAVAPAPAPGPVVETVDNAHATTPAITTADTPEQPLAAAAPVPAPTPVPAPEPTLSTDPTPAATATDTTPAPAKPAPPAAPQLHEATEAADITPPPAPLLPGARRVVYVVDASGSMIDSMNQGVLTWLETQIGSLHRADTFSVIFFRDDELLETPPAGLKPGHEAQQTQALDWMSPESGNMRPRGRSRPLAAIRRAASYGANEIVLLTDDNFGVRSGEDVSPDALAELLHPAEPDATAPTVHTVQFFYEDSEGRLQAISERFGGRHEFVEEPPFEARPALDDLLGG